MGVVRLRFYEELNDFLAPARRKRDFDHTFARGATVQNAMHDHACTDRAIRRIAAAESRVILTRDRALLKCRDVTRGCYVRAVEPAAQLAEIVGRLQLAASMAPFTRCLKCNLPLAEVDRDEVRDRVPATVAQADPRLKTCFGCRRVYWEGSHWQRMVALLDRVRAGRM
ncbi:MAG: hypothetical protein OHK0044_18230 [Burkholderiaceae bacterium]